MKPRLNSLDGKPNSPFVPGTNFQFAYDSTSLGWLKECDRKYYYYMICGYRKASAMFVAEDALHLDFGITYHRAKELYYKRRARGETHDDALDFVVDFCLKATWVATVGPDGVTVSGPWVSPHPKKTRDSLLRTVIWNLDMYKDDPSETVILSNGAPAVELSFKFELDRMRQIDDKPYLLCGHMDRLGTFGDDKFVFDYKTTGSSIGPYFFEQYNPDNQMSIYTLASRVIYNVPVAGVIVEAAQILVGTSDFNRGFSLRTEAQLNEFLEDTMYWFDRAERNVMSNYWPMNDKSCHHYGGCAFRQICNKDPAVRDKFLESDYTIRPWNPLEPR